MCRFKISIFWIILLIFAFTSMGNDNESNDTLIVSARLVEIPGKFPPNNDLYSYVYVMKYRVIKVEQGNYGEKEILIGHYNPLVPRKRIKGKMAKKAQGDVEKFVVGDKHRMVLITPIEAVCENIEEDYQDSELEKYYALRVNTIE